MVHTATEQHRTTWHDLCPWPVAEGAEWRAMASYLHDPATQQQLAEGERERRYPEEARRQLHALGLSRFLAEPSSANADHAEDFPDPEVSCLTLPHICRLEALLASVNTSLAVTVSVNTLALLPAYIGARPEQLAWLFAQVEGGAFGPLLLTELGHGSDLFNTDTRAEPGVLGDTGQFIPLASATGTTPTSAPTHYRLTGRKDLINGASRHELLMVFARTKPQPTGITSPLAARNSFSLFAATRAPGVTSPHRWHTAPAPAADISSLQFNGVVVPATRRIGREGDGFTLVQQTLAMTRGGVSALASGLATRAVRLATHNAHNWQLYGHPITSLGAIADHLLRMQALELLATAMSVKAAALLNCHGPGAGYHAAVAKVVSCALTEELVNEGHLVHGSRALLLDEPYHQLVADAPLFGTFDGTTHVVLDQLQWRLAQFAVPGDPPSRRSLDDIRAAYQTPPQPLLAVVRKRATPLLPHPAAYLRELDDLAGVGALAPLIALADTLLALVRHCRSTDAWDSDQGLRFEAARLLADLETLIAALELADPFLRPALGLPSPTTCTSRLAPLIEFTYGWFGGRIAATLRSLALRAGLPVAGRLDEAEAALARACAHGRSIFRREPALLGE